MSYKLGVDVGGTFTDFLLFGEEEKSIYLTKVPTTPENQAEGIMDGVVKITGQAGIDPAEIEFFIHGTTIATNAILEMKGVKTLLITTKGFRDVLHIMRQNRPKLYDFFARRPLPLVPRNLRLEVDERILYDGRIERKLKEAHLMVIQKTIERENVKSVAVCLLHSYANGIHEKKIKEWFAETSPRLHISISSEILPEIREYERMSTTVINAYVQPIIEDYISDLSGKLKKVNIKKSVHIMQSNGGIMPSSLVGQKSAGTILSGPAAGVTGGVALAAQMGQKNVITVDMGGTSFDICLAHNGEPKFSSEYHVAGHSLKMPMIDIHTIGAGGGSIAWIDAGSILKVGPQSAGADPGPVCYGKGGDKPTVTDANLILGRLNKDYFLGGAIPIDSDAAYRAIKEKIADPLGLEVNTVAEGIIKVVNAAMVKGIRFVSVEKGYDPREFGLICFGGNGPLHAAELAEELQIPRVIVPFAPGVNCAFGLLMADFRYDYVKTYLKKINEVNMERIQTLFKDLEDEARGKMLLDGVPPENIDILRTLDLRYVGQGYEIQIPLSAGIITRHSLSDSQGLFNREHQKKYGFSSEEENVEIVNVRIACIGREPKPQWQLKKITGETAGNVPKGKRKVYLRGCEYFTDIYERQNLPPASFIRGPAVIEQADSTTLLFPGNSGEIDAYGNIIIHIEDKL